MNLFEKLLKKINKPIRRNLNINTNFLTPLFNNSSVFYKDRLIETYNLIYSVIDRKSKAVAQLPLKLYKNETIKDGKLTLKRKVLMENSVSRLINNTPNINMTPFIFWRTIIAQKEIYGNAYVYIRRSNLNEVIELQILDPSKVNIYMSENTNEIYYKINSDKGEYFLHNLDILHFPSIYITGYKGVSFIECLKSQLELKENVIKINSEQMDKSIKAGSILKLPSNLSFEKMEYYKESFEKNYSQGFNGLIVVDSGMEFSRLKNDINDLKQLDINKITAREVSSVSGLPLFMLGESETKYINMEHQTIDFVQNCVAPDVILIEQELNRKLLSETEIRKGYYFRFNLNALMRSDMNSRADFYTKMLSVGAMTLNEVRSLEDLESYGEIGERPVISLNYSYLDTLDNHERIKGGDQHE